MLLTRTTAWTRSWHDLGFADGQPERHRTTHRVADDDDLVQVEPAEHHRHVVDRPIEGERLRHRRRAAEAALVHRHHVVAGGLQVSGEEAEDAQVGPVAVQQQDGRPGATLLDVQVATVRRRDSVGRGAGEAQVDILVSVGGGEQRREHAPLISGGGHGAHGPGPDQKPPGSHCATFLSRARSAAVLLVVFVRW